MIKMMKPKEAQAIIRDFRKQGLEIVKKQEGLYEARDGETSIFTATKMNGFYVMRLDNAYFAEAES